MERRSGLSRYTLMRALKAGKLHGMHTGVNGTWRVREECFENWLEGERCAHQAVAA
ncbi:helix-turn-helix domain-containing protein [Microbacterium sp. 69-7]|uniref:helix-turn-helix domain-containing protein n=1 Tax=Microbacterium sp. 69-7 TaxID=1895784 RepID=UPI00258B883D|nr:helix-turn-helix domain-containing protein [Microbacterium sp. 69-7]